MLLDMGAEPDPDAKSSLLRYIQKQHPKREVLAATKLGWHGGGYLMPDRYFAPANDEIDVALQDGVLHSSGLFERRGALAAWSDSVASYAPGNPLLTLTLSSAFAAPLLKPCHIANGGFHINGETSTGIRDRAGWYEDSDKGRVYLFTHGGMKEALAGFDLRRGLDVLEAAGWLTGRDSANPTKGKQTWINGGNVRAFRVLPGDDVKTGLDRLGGLGDCSAKEKLPNPILTQQVRQVRNDRLDSSDQPNLTRLTHGLESGLGDKIVTNQHPNPSNPPNPEKIHNWNENTFFDDGNGVTAVTGGDADPGFVEIEL